MHSGKKLLTFLVSLLLPAAFLHGEEQITVPEISRLLSEGLISEKKSEAEDFPVFKDAVSGLIMRTVWTELYGPVTLAEKLDAQTLGLYSVKTFYDASADEGSWVYDILKMENPDVVGIPEVLKNVSYGNTEGFSSEDVYERLVKSRSEELGLYVYGGEQVAVQDKDDGKIFIFSDGKRVVRKFFDTAMRLQKKEIWKQGSEAAAKPDTVQNFKYEGNAAVPVSSVISSVDLKQYLKYNDKGFVVRSEDFRIYRKDENSRGRYYRDSLTEWKFGEDGKVLEKSSVLYEYNKIHTAVTGSTSRREEYQYKVSDSAPDYFYFEDGKLRLSTVYSSEDSYHSTMIFDGGFTIESWYADGKHSKDIYYLNGIVKRTVNYDK